MTHALIHVMILFILAITLSLYIGWAQHDDFSFYVILLLLVCVLYFVSNHSLYVSGVELFSEQPTSSGGGAAGVGGTAAAGGGTPIPPLDLKAFKSLGELKNDVVKIVQPKFENLIAAFKGNATGDAVKYDEKGEEIEEKKPDEVPVPKDKEGEIRSVNMWLRDLMSFDPGTYYTLLALASGKPVEAVREEYVL